MFCPREIHKRFGCIDRIYMINCNISLRTNKFVERNNEYLVLKYMAKTTVPANRSYLTDLWELFVQDNKSD